MAARVGGAAATGALVAGAAAPAVVVAGVQAMGFGACGIVAGSTAAGWMSSAAIADGGGVAVGGLVASLQSVGAAGLGAGTMVGVAAGGAALGMLVVGGTAAAAVALDARIQRCRECRRHAEQSAGPVEGQWTVATEEGVGNVKFYPFSSEESSMTEEGCGNVKIYLFHCEENARSFFNGLLVACIIVDPSGREIDHKDMNPCAVNTIRTHALQNPAGNWKVVTEEGCGNVKEYRFDIAENARVFFDGLFVARILVDPEGKEVSSAGQNPWAVSIVRTQALQKPGGPWKVATEEGPGNVKTYDFDVEETARVFFKGLFCSRILIDPSRKEIDHGGWNPWALNTIRKTVL
mmetsp:Transcript_53431/g.153295  ORF Transcript_53431/g.153295 Transcript_53431/m.153295 type:complete len:349 (-) Transcript_53431:112-1158(-)